MFHHCRFKSLGIDSIILEGYAVDISFVQSQVGRLPSILSESKPVSYS